MNDSSTELPNCINDKCKFNNKNFVENCSKGIWVDQCESYIEELTLLPMAKQLMKERGLK